MKKGFKRAKHLLKSGVLEAKSGYLGVEKIRGCKQTRKAKWCKMQVLFFNIDKAIDVED